MRTIAIRQNQSTLNPNPSLLTVQAHSTCENTPNTAKLTAQQQLMDRWAWQPAALNRPPHREWPAAPAASGNGWPPMKQYPSYQGRPVTEQRTHNDDEQQQALMNWMQSQ
jgi:hypothetical protein